MNNYLKGHLYLFTGSIIGGFHYSIIKLIMPQFLAPNSIIVLRDIISAIFFGILYLIFCREKIEKKDIPGLMLCAVFGAAANQLLFFGGLNLTTPINASLMMIGSPFFVIIFSVVTGKERMTSNKIIGISLSALGVLLLLFYSSAKGIDQLYIGDLMVLVNAVFWGAFVVFIKPYTAKYNILTIMSFLFFCGSIYVLPFGYNSLIHTDWAAMTDKAWMALAFIIFIATLIQYFLNVYVLKFVDPSIAGSYTYLQPVIASIIAISMGQDILSIEKVVLSLLIFTGIYLVSKKTVVKDNVLS